MRKIKKITIFVNTILIVLSILLIGIVFSVFNFTVVEAGTTTGSNLGELVKSETKDSVVFNETTVQNLFNRLANKTGATLDDIKNVVKDGNTVNNDDFYNQGGEVGVTVSINGLQWCVMFLSQNRQGDPIISLWQTYSTDFAQWNTVSSDSDGITPTNMYATSTIRAVTLNNGGTIYSDNNGGGATTVNKSFLNKYAKYTMDDIQGSLTKFIETPANVAWQETEKSTDYNEKYYIDNVNTGSTRVNAVNYNNDCYGNVSPGSLQNGIDYSSYARYGDWKNDKLWLPSFAEVGWSGWDETIESGQALWCKGMWSSRAIERRNDISSANPNAMHSWVRSAAQMTRLGAYTIASDGDGRRGTAFDVTESYAVRPCFHLNLAKVGGITASQIKGDAKKYYSEISGTPNDVTFELEGVDTAQLNISIVATDMDGKTITAPTYSVSGNVLSFKVNTVGKYVVKATPKSGMYWADGTASTKEYEYKLKYHVTPLVWKNGSSVEYNAKKQYLEVDNFDEDKMKVTPTLEKIPDGEPNAGNWAVSVMGFADKNKVKVELKNTDFMEWSDDDTSLAKEALVYSVTKKALTATPTTTDSWKVMTDESTKTYEVLLDCFESDIPNLKLEGYYSKSVGGSEIKIDTTITTVKDGNNLKATLTLPSIESVGKYKYILKLTPGITTNNNYSLTFSKDFDVENKKIDIEDSDVIWRYTNSKVGDDYIIVDKTKLDENKIFNVDYNGAEYAFDVDTSALSDDVDYAIESESSATNVKLNGSAVTFYTVKFKIKLKSGSTGIEIKTDTFELKWKINKAKFDLSNVKWVYYDKKTPDVTTEYTQALGYSEKTWGIKLIGLPNGLSFDYDSNAERMQVGNYTANVANIKVDDSIKDNYIKPIITDDATYIYDVSGKTMPWSLSWQIEQGELDLEWEKSRYEDANARRFSAWVVSSNYAQKVEYKYYKAQDYDAATGTAKGDSILLSDIKVEPESEVDYYVVAALNSSSAKNYKIKEGTQYKLFTVGTLAPIREISMNPQFTYDGKAHGTSSEWKVESIEYIIAKYYEITNDGGDSIETLLTDAPINVGKYVVKFDIQEGIESFELSVYKIEYEIVKAEIEITFDGNSFKYDGADHGGSIKIVDNKYDVNKLIKKYYRGSEALEENLIEGLPTEAGEYCVVLALSDDDSKNYAIKESCTTFTYTIAPAQIKVKWNNNGKSPVIDGLSDDEKEVIEYEYQDLDGNVVKENQLEEGKTYKIIAKIKEEFVDNYVFTKPNGEILETPKVSGIYEFEYGNENPIVPDDPSNPENPDSGNVNSGNNNLPNGGNGNALDELIKKAKELPLWQLIAIIISVMFTLIFLSKTASNASKIKKSKRLIEKKYNSYYVATLLGMGATSWTAIASVFIGVAVLSLVLMIISKAKLNKINEELDDAKEEYEKKKEEMLFMRLANNGGMGAQGYAYAQPSLGADEIRGIVSETMTAMLPNVQQFLPQQASVNDEFMQKLIDKEDKNDETINKLIEQNDKLMQQLAEKPSEKVIEKEIVATSANDETIKKIVDSQEKFMERSQKQDEVISRLMEKIIEMSSNQPIHQVVASQPQVIEKIVEKPVEKIVEKEVRVEVPVEKVVEKVVEKEVKVEVPIVKESKSKAESKPKKTPTPRLTLAEAYAKLTKEQKKYFDGLREYAMKKDSKCKEKLATYFTTIGPSTTNPLIKLTIKKGITVALFKMEDEYLKDIRRNASSDGAKVKVKETEIAIPDEQSYDTAKDMIDLRIDQIERYEDYLKEQKAMRRK